MDEEDGPTTAGGATDNGDDQGDIEDSPDWLSFAAFAK